jgi:CAAX protease family protein
MNAQPMDLPGEPQGFLARIRHWALLRIVVDIVVLVVVVAVSSRILSLYVPLAPSPLHTPLAMARNLVVAALLLGTYALLVWGLERRRAVEIGLGAGIVQWPAGAVVGIGLMATVYLILWGMNLASFAPGNGVGLLGAGLVAAFLAAVFEELLLRAVLFRITEEACGTTIALLVSAIVFGLLHGFNPGATPFSDAAIALEAGLLLALAFALTRNLWFAIGLHMGWNFAEGSLFGAQVSGGAILPSFVHSTLKGPLLLTGGNFGPEASIVSIGVCGTAALIFGIIVVRRGGWRPRRFRLSLA